MVTKLVELDEDKLARISRLLHQWHHDAAKPSQGTDYDTGQYDALMVCISELHAALTGGGNAGQCAVRYKQQRDVVTGVVLGLCLMGLGWVSLAAF